MENGQPGPRIYRLAEGGVVSPGGLFSITERWFWFWGDPSQPEKDVVDTVEYRGVPSSAWTAGDLGCSQCEEIYEVDLQVVDNPSNWSYESDAKAIYIFDNLGPNSTFHEDHQAIVFKSGFNPRGEPLGAVEYAHGTWIPDDDQPGGRPASVTWEPVNTLGDCW